MYRRTFLQLGIGSAAGALTLQHLPQALGSPFAFAAESTPPFKLSLAQWSLNKSFFGRVEPKRDPLDFAKIANGFGIEGLEYVNQFFMDKARDQKYLQQLKSRAEDHGCRSLLIMCDREGDLGDPSEQKRLQAVENHVPWLEAARFLGCHSIRVNAYSQGTFEEQQKLVVDGLRRLCEKGQQFGLNVIVENHGGLSSDAEWLTGVIRLVDLPNVGTLPDFGNFGSHDPYRGVQLLMPYARGVSAKAHFDQQGNCLTVDYPAMMRIVRDAGWDQYVGIESSASEGISEMQAIELTRDLLMTIQKQWEQCQSILDDSLDGWKKIEGGQWSLDDGVLVGRNGQNWTTNPETSGSWLYYDQPVADFRLELQYMISDPGNSGVLFRSQLDKNPSFTGYEMQITASQSDQPNKGGTPGAIYDLVAPTKNAAHPPGQWNTVTIIAQGPKIAIEMNRERIIETQQDRSMKGYIGLQNHDERSVVRFKNVRLQLL